VQPRKKAAREKRGCRDTADGRAAKRASSCLYRTRPVEELTIPSAESSMKIVRPEHPSTEHKPICAEEV
jgi:hypothetical protein